MIKAHSLVLLALLVSVAPLAAQAPSDARCRTGFVVSRDDLTGPLADFARAAELVGAAPLRPRLIRRASDEPRFDLFCGTDAPTPWDERAIGSRRDGPADTDGWNLSAIAPKWRIVENSAYPRDRNDGALWAGRGLNTAFSIGMAARRGPVSVRLAPQLLFHQNRDFDRVDVVRPPGYSPEIYPWHPGRIDWPQRPGESSFWLPDLGQSHIRLDTHAITLGLSTENLWWGPALHNPLVLSNTAPGFPHLFFGTGAPVVTPLGEVEAQIVWGELRESRHFDGDRSNDRRTFSGFIVDVQPRPVPGLFLGMSRAHVGAIPDGGISLPTRFARPFARPAARHLDDGRDASYRILSFFARWAFPDAGFESYAEWASTATWDGLGDFVREPERGQAFTLGLQHVRPVGERWLRLFGELNHLTGGTGLPREGGAISFYTDTRVPQGHTHRGQLLGASIGPGADAQSLGADLFDRRGRIGIFVERVRYDDDAFHAVHAPFYGPAGQDFELSAGVRQLLFLPHLDLGWTLGYSRRRNRNFLDLDRFRYEYRVEGNWSLDVQLNLRIDGETDV